MPTAVCLVSGGLDSTVAATWTAQKYDLLALHVSYGQRCADRELACAKQIASHLGALEFRSTALDLLTQLGHSALTDRSIEIPRGTISTDEVPITQVPFRNGIMLALATAWAEAADASAVVIGAVEEDSSGYPDCREQFLIAFERAVQVGTRPECDIRIIAPLVHKTKGDIVRLGAELGAPLHLTWSCYEAGPEPCGQCESCLLRARGFHEADVADPLLA